MSTKTRRLHRVRTFSEPWLWMDLIRNENFHYRSPYVSAEAVMESFVTNVLNPRLKHITEQFNKAMVGSESLQVIIDDPYERGELVVGAASITVYGERPK